jgi:hypothetical protein
VATALENVFYKNQTVTTDVSCLIEYNMNSLIDGVSVSNIEVDSDYTSDAAYRAQISRKDPSDNTKTIAYPSDAPIPFKKLFPLESVVKEFRPHSSDIKYLIPGIGDNLSVGVGGDKIQPYDTRLYPSTSPRLYYPGISNAYKYWVGAKNKKIALRVTYKHDSNSWTASKNKGSIPAGNKNALANKIVVRFNKYHSRPASAQVIITKSDNTTSTITLPVGDPAFDTWTGDIVLYYNGTTWTTTNSGVYDYTQQIKSIELRATPQQGTTPSADIAVIEISARLIKDITSDMISLSINQESSSTDESMLPVGVVNSNTMSLSLANYNTSTLKTITYDRNITQFDTTKLYLVKNARLNTFFKVYHSAATYAADPRGSYDKVNQGEYFIDTFSIAEHGEYEITALDGAKILMDKFCPDILCEKYPVTAILRRLLDSVGFTNYNFNIKDTDDNSIPTLAYWYTDDSQTVWEAIQELCKDSQINAFFDKENVLQIYTRNAIYDTDRPVDWQFFYGTAYDSTDGRIFLPNIINMSKDQIPSANAVKVLWQTPISSSFTGNSGKLWTSPPYILAAGSLGSDMTTTSDEFVINLQTIDVFAQQESLFSFNGFVLIDSEIIEYDAIEYQYRKKLETDNQLYFAWISSEADLNQYRYESRPGAMDINRYQETANFKPSGKYRVKKDSYNTLVGRGALGTTAAEHKTYNKSIEKWSVRKVSF